ncbi:MAG: hypothetical protein KIT31_23790 [Deltaproteobacteria bacterium]|nr:hypothetical protein [Deltaproteobacteria bacterium]
MRWALCLVVATACWHERVPDLPPVPPPPPGPPAELRIPELDEYRKPNASMLVDRVYVYGRSDNLIAYLHEPADDACGCYEVIAIVQDLTSGLRIWSDRYKSEEIHPDGPPQVSNLQQIWDARGAVWELNIRAFGITRETVTALHVISTTGRSVPRLAIHKRKVGDDSNLGYAHLTSYRIDLITTAGDTTIAAQTEHLDTFDLLEVEVPGYLPPRGNGRAAVLIVERRRGWEGLPYLAGLRFAGADLR